MKSFATEFLMPGQIEFTDQATHLFNSCLNLMVVCIILFTFVNLPFGSI
jgi:hypothetical protein